MTFGFEQGPVSHSPPQSVSAGRLITWVLSAPRLVRSSARMAASWPPKNLSILAVSSAEGLPVTAATASAITSLASLCTSLNLASVAGSIVRHGCVGGLIGCPDASLASQSTVFGAAAPMTTSTARDVTKSIFGALAVAFPMALLTATGLGALVSAVLAASARDCASAAGSSGLI